MKFNKDGSVWYQSGTKIVLNSRNVRRSTNLARLIVGKGTDQTIPRYRQKWFREMVDRLIEKSQKSQKPQKPVRAYVEPESRLLDQGVREIGYNTYYIRGIRKKELYSFIRANGKILCIEIRSRETI